MSRPAHRQRRAGPGVRAEDLLEVLGRLEPATLLAARPCRGGTELAVRRLDPDPRCGAAMLFGIRAPAGTSVLAASFLGRVADAVDGPDTAPSGRTIRVDVAVDRTGRLVSGLTGAPEGSEPTGRRPAMRVGGIDGRLVDALHCVLGLPSPGVPPALESLIAAMWSTDILGLLADPAAVPTWRDVVGVHPGADTGERVPAVPPSPEAVAVMTSELAAGTTWARLWDLAVDGRFSVPEVGPDEVAWMDETLFARWVVESFVPPGTAVEALRARGAHHAAAGLGRVLALVPTVPPVA